jgi:cysteinyl-tRNA synthetase
MSPPMTLSLYDPSAGGLCEVPADRTPVLVCGPTLGAPDALAALRPRVLHDVLSRALLFQKYEPDTGLGSELAAAVRAELDDACEAETLRYWSLTAHYRAPLTWVESAAEPGTDTAGSEQSSGYPSLDESERRLSYLYAAKKRLLELPEERIINVQTAPAAALATLPDGLTQALERDFDTPLALAEIQEFAIAVNALCDHALRKKGRVNLSAVQSAQAGFATIEGLLGLGADAPASFLQRVRDRRARRQNIDPSAIDGTVLRRAAARAQQDFVTADRLQAELLELGVTLLDGPEGSTWTLT